MSGDETSDQAADAELDRALRRVFQPVPPTAPDELVALFGRPNRFEHRSGRVTFDSAGDPALVGVRAAAALDARQVVVDAAPWTLVLDVVPDPDGGLLTVRGELLGTDAVAAVQLLDGGAEIALGVTDEVGEFTFVGIPVGTYELVVATALTEVSAPVELR